MVTSIQKHELRALANRCGFDDELSMDSPDWFGFVNTTTGCRVWLNILADERYLVGIEHESVFKRLVPEYVPGFCDVKPVGAFDCVIARDFNNLSCLLWELSSAPSAEDLLNLYRTETAQMPRNTEIEVLAVERVGQDLYRKALFEYWHGACAVTGLDIPELLRASHIKPWAVAEDKERLDVYNGFLLSPNLDLLFDQGFITFDENGKLIISSMLNADNRLRLGLKDDMHLNLTQNHIHYLQYHWEHIYKA